MISDACGGQTRNQFIACLCLYLVRMMEDLEKIDHMSMVLGYSHMEVDSMDARIENKSDTLNIYKQSDTVHWTSRQGYLSNDVVSWLQ